MARNQGAEAGSALVRTLIVAALAAPFLLALPQRALIPSWYDASLYLADFLLLLHGGVLLFLIASFIRRSSWRWPARVAASLGVSLIGIAAAVTNVDGSIREGLFVCGRELRLTLPCARGGQAFEFDSVCIAGNPKVEVAVRPGTLPLMHFVSDKSAAAACVALER